MPDIHPHTTSYRHVSHCLTRRQALTVLGAAGALGAVSAMSGCEESDYATFILTGEVPEIEEGSVEPTEETEVWQSPYDWSAVTSDAKGRKYYYPDGILSSRFGIDVSSYSGTIDWESAAADGVEFAIVRLGYRGYTEGGLFVDDQYEANLFGARAQAVPVGAYFFSSAIDEDEAREEARYALELLDGFELDYPLVYDQETVSELFGRANWLSNNQYTANAQAFCEEVTAAGYEAMIYGNQRYLNKLDLEVLAPYPIWYAEYGVSAPTDEIDLAIWQYADSGPVAGISGPVDLNIQFL